MSGILHHQSVGHGMPLQSAWNQGVFPEAAQVPKAAIHRSLGVGFTVEIADRILLPEDQALQIRRGADHRVDFA